MFKKRLVGITGFVLVGVYSLIMIATTGTAATYSWAVLAAALGLVASTARGAGRQGSSREVRSPLRPETRLADRNAPTATTDNQTIKSEPPIGPMVVSEPRVSMRERIVDKQKAGVIIPALLLATWMPGCSSAGTDSDPTGLPLPTSSTTLVVSTTALPTTTGPTTSTTSVTAAKPPRWVRPDVCQGPCHPALEVLFTIPVGDDSGVGYRNVDQEETFPSGPSAIALDEEGHVWVADAVNRRILGYSRRGAPIATIDLTPYDVASAVDLAAGPNGFLLLDIYVAMERYRLHELDPSGGLLATHDLPKGLHFEDGLTGVSMGPEGELWIELEGGARIADLDVGEDSVGFTISPGYSYPNGTYGPVAGDPFAYQTPDIAVDVTTTAEFGGLTMLSVNPDRSFVLQLDEVTLDATGAFQVNQTIHLFDHDGYHLGETGFRVAEQFAGVEHPLVVAPDGNTYALMTRRDHVAIARLPYGTGEEFGPDWRQTV